MYGVAVAMVAMQDRPHGAAVWAVIALNTVWAVDSLVVAGLGWGSPTAVGTVWIVLQAIVVTAFAALQLLGLRRLN